VGLGLAISRAIVEGHGGTIDVASVVGAGTCFVVRLPLAPTTGDRLDSSSADTSTRGRESG
jgi:signal transduction histidine kinase